MNMTNRAGNLTSMMSDTGTMMRQPVKSEPRYERMRRGVFT